MSKRKIHPNSLANLRKWKPGQSGNPSGRPKGKGLVSAILRELGKEDLAKSPDGKRMSVNEAIARRIVRDALDENSKFHAQAVQIFLDRTEGKALERVFEQLDLSGGAVVPTLIDQDAQELREELQRLKAKLKEYQEKE